MPEPAARAAVAMWAAVQAAVAIAADQAADHRQGAQSRNVLLMSALAAFSMLAKDSGPTPQGTFCGSSPEQTLQTFWALLLRRWSYCCIGTSDSSPALVARNFSTSRPPDRPGNHSGA